MAVLVIGTLDTKEQEYAFLSARIRDGGGEVVLVDVGVLGDTSLYPDVPAHEVAAAGGGDLDRLREAGDRGAALRTMSAGAVAYARRMVAEDRVDGVVALGGSGGSSIAAAVMAAVPLGMPKLLVSTMAGGDVAAYVGTTDVTLMYSVVDVAGVNSVSRQVLDNAAAAVLGMAGAYARRRSAPPAGDKPIVAASMFGVTTPAVDAARERLEELGYEVLVFHATGSGGRVLEALVAGGHVDGVLDLTTTELADEVVGGVLSAGPDRLTAAGRSGIPQVVSLGALDMVNFGPRDTVPHRFADRHLLVHNDTVTLMRTTPEENAEIGGRLGAHLASATGPTVLVVPRGGFSAIDRPDGPFWDAGAAAVDAVLARLDGSAVEVVDDARHINDPTLAAEAADRLHEMIQKGRS
ncbi:MAG: Tm-1-like ATP-binding domain-containing protein [Pseudonocardia sp.]